jgi:hypothetical protein
MSLSTIIIIRVIYIIDWFGPLVHYLFPLVDIPVVAHPAKDLMVHVDGEDWKLVHIGLRFCHLLEVAHIWSHG